MTSFIMALVLFEVEINEPDHLQWGTTRQVTKRRILTRTGLKLYLYSASKGLLRNLT